MHDGRFIEFCEELILLCEKFKIQGEVEIRNKELWKNARSQYFRVSIEDLSVGNTNLEVEIPKVLSYRGRLSFKDVEK